MFRLIVRNLLSNAIKFTPSGGRISIWAELQEAYCCLHIQDTGLGLSPQKISSLLEEAQVASQEGTWQEEGTGLGLFLVRDFIRKNQGVFQIQSTEGQGSTFSCSFLREAPLA
jgi:signal transduction histidine kinase